MDGSFNVCYSEMNLCCIEYENIEDKENELKK